MTGRSIAINDYSYIWRLSAYDTLAHLADQGYREFEVLVNAPHLWPSELGRAGRRRVERILVQRDLRLLSLNPPMLDLNLVSPAPEVRQYTVAHYRQVIELAGEWGARFVIVVPGRTHPLLPIPSERRDGYLQAGLHELDRAAEREGVSLVMENVPASFLPHANHLMEALARMGLQRMGILYDVANGVFAREDPAEGLRKARPRLQMVHLSDTGLSSWQHATIGSGVVPFQSVAAALDEIGYSGPTVLEIISDDPDRDIAASHEALVPLGWAARP